MRIVYFILILFFQSQVWAGDILSAQASARSYPFSGSIEVQYKAENLLWTKNESVFYGYWQPKLSLSSSGTAEVALLLYPISFWEVSAAQSITSRFYKIKKFDCDLQICGGIVERRKLGTRLILGKKFDVGTLFVVPSYQFVEMRHADQSKPLADESEMNLAKSGGESVIINSLFLGLKKEMDVFGALWRSSRYSSSDRRADSQYLVYRTQRNDFNYTAGIGTFKSDVFKSEISVIFQMSWQKGESIGLF